METPRGEEKKKDGTQERERQAPTTPEMASACGVLLQVPALEQSQIAGDGVPSGLLC